MYELEAFFASNLFLYKHTHKHKMKRIELESLVEKSKDYIGKPFYFKKETYDSCTYHIFYATKIDDKYIYTKNGYMFSTLYKANKAYMYDMQDTPILQDYIKELYVLTEDEFRNTYYTFFKYDKYSINQLPFKIIQDV